MGADIHSFTEVRREGKWDRIDEPIFQKGYDGKNSTSPFDWRSYSMFGFLADVRNYSYCVPLAEPRGLPKDSDYLNEFLEKPVSYAYAYHDNGKAYTVGQELELDMDYHSHSYFTLKELLDFDYNQEMWDRRVTKQTGPNSWNGAALAEDGEGEIITYRSHLGDSFFEDIESLKTLGNPEDVRVVFYFDN